MDKVFVQILNMSLTASYVILFVFLARLPLKKVPKVFSYALWSAVLFRLICPFSFESILSLIPSSVPTVTVPPRYFTVIPPPVGTPEWETFIFSSNHSAYITEPVRTVYDVMALVWLIGIAALLIYSLVSLLRLRSKLVGSVKWRDNIYFADHIPSPFVMGIIRPKIYLPSTLSENEREYVVLHEQTHIRRFDYISKIIAFFALVVHWFNPLAWLAYVLLIRDMEMSCDESVMKQMDTDIRQSYSASLLSLATGRKIIAGTPLAFGEGNTKGRIKNVMNYKKPTLWIVIAAVLLVTVLTVGFAVNRANGAADSDVPVITATETIDGAQATALHFGYSWFDGENGMVADAIPTWQGKYTAENTLVIDGEMGQNMIALSAENPATVSYKVYRTDGTVYDDGTRAWHDSLSPRLYEDKSGMGIIAPFDPGEYIYEITIGWEKNDLTVTYGLKLIMTGERSTYDEALDIVWGHCPYALSVSMSGRAKSPEAEYAEDWYYFTVELPDGLESQQVAVSKERGIFFTRNDGEWFAFTGGGMLETTAFSSESPDKKMRLAFSPGESSDESTSLNILDAENDQLITHYQYPADTQFVVCWSADSQYVAVGYANGGDRRTVIYIMGKDRTNIGKEIFSPEFSHFRNDESIVTSATIHPSKADEHIIPTAFTDDATLLLSIDWLDKDGNRVTRAVNWDFEHAVYTAADYAPHHD